MLVGEGVEGREREGIVTLRRQAGVRRSVTSFFPPPLAAAAAAWKRLEKWNKQGEGRENEEVHC